MVEAGRKMTEAEFMAIPDDGRKYELVDGKAREVPTGGKHGRIASILNGLAFAASARQHGELFDSSTGFRMATGNIRSPDVSFMRRERLPEGEAPAGFVEGAPDLCVEIITPSEDRGDIYRKLDEHFASGAQQVWHVFPEARRVVIHRSLDDVRTLEGEDTLDGDGLLSGFRCRLTELF